MAALQEGQDVPADVLADYPELAAAHGPKALAMGDTFTYAGMECVLGRAEWNHVAATTQDVEGKTRDLTLYYPELATNGFLIKDAPAPATLPHVRCKPPWTPQCVRSAQFRHDRGRYAGQRSVHRQVPFNRCSFPGYGNHRPVRRKRHDAFPGRSGLV